MSLPTIESGLLDAAYQRLIARGWGQRCCGVWSGMPILLLAVNAKTATRIKRWVVRRDSGHPLRHRVGRFEYANNPVGRKAKWLGIKTRYLGFALWVTDVDDIFVVFDDSSMTQLSALTQPAFS